MNTKHNVILFYFFKKMNSTLVLVKTDVVGGTINTPTFNITLNISSKTDVACVR